MKYFKIKISEAVQEPSTKKRYSINQFSEAVETIEDVKEYLVGRYGRLPGGRNKTFRDNIHGEADVIGFVHSYWVKGSPNSYFNTAYRQTDWIEVTEVTENVILIHSKKKKGRNRVTLDDVDHVNIENIMHYYKIADDNHDRQRYVSDMLKEVEYIINRHLTEKEKEVK